MNVLPASYSGLASILHNTDVLADPEGDEDVHPPADNPMDADSSTSSSQPARRRVPFVTSIVSFLESYL